MNKNKPFVLKALQKSSSYTYNRAYGNRNPCRNNRSRELSGESEPERNRKCVSTV